MIVKEKERQALAAIQYVVIRARSMAYHGESHSEIGDVLDVAEYLLGLVCREDDCTDKLREQLADLASRKGFQAALEYFNGERI